MFSDLLEHVRASRGPPGGPPPLGVQLLLRVLLLPGLVLRCSEIGGFGFINLGAFHQVLVFLELRLLGGLRLCLHAKSLGSPPAQGSSSRSATCASLAPLAVAAVPDSVCLCKSCPHATSLKRPWRLPTAPVAKRSMPCIAACVPIQNPCGGPACCQSLPREAKRTPTW